MFVFICLLLACVFAVLSGLHIYWLLGGTWGVKQVIPVRDSQAELPKIPPIATLVVALGLGFVGLLYLVKGQFLSLSLPHWMFIGFSWGVPLIFLLRAVGDFQYVGFFKKNKDTAFAKADSKYFVPLCLAIGVMGLALQLLFV